MINWETNEALSTGTRKFLAQINKKGATPLEEMSVADARKSLEDLQTVSNKDYKLPSDIIHEQHTLEFGKYNNTVTFHHFHHRGVEHLQPTFLFIHGGGWVLGDTATHIRLISGLVESSGCDCISIDYTRAPEAKFPYQLEEIEAILEFIKEGNIDTIDANRLGIVGNSAGGNMSIAMCLKHPDVFKLAVLMWPVTDYSQEYKSFDDYAEGYYLTKSEMAYFWHCYISDKKYLTNRFAVPIIANETQLKNMPETLMLIAENDVLRDQGKEFYRKLDKAGVKATCTEYLGVTHDWGFLDGYKDLSQTENLISEAGNKICEVLYAE